MQDPTTNTVYIVMTQKKGLQPTQGTPEAVFQNHDQAKERLSELFKDPNTQSVWILPKQYHLTPVQAVEKPPVLISSYPGVSGSEKVLTLLRGLPGSGKSTLATHIRDNVFHTTIVSADDFWLINAFITPRQRESYGKHFDPQYLPLAHQWCQANTLRNMMREKNIVVDNTNVKFEHVKPYIELAVKKRYTINVQEPQTPWAKDPTTCGQKTTHRVPPEVIQKMAEEWEPKELFMRKVIYYAQLIAFDEKEIPIVNVNADLFPFPEPPQPVVTHDPQYSEHNQTLSKAAPSEDLHTF